MPEGVRTPPVNPPLSPSKTFFSSTHASFMTLKISFNQKAQIISLLKGWMEKYYRYFLSEIATDGKDKDDADEIVTIDE